MVSGSDDEGRDRLNSPDGQAALRSLTPIERLLCRRLIARQFAHAPKLSRDLGNYGLEGTVQLCAATALRVYVLAGILIVIVIAIAGISVVAIAVFGLLTLVTAGLAIVRGISADRTGREWRRNQAGTSGANRLG